MIRLVHTMKNVVKDNVGEHCAKQIKFFHNSRLIRRIEQIRIYKKIGDNTGD